MAMGLQPYEGTTKNSSVDSGTMFLSTRQLRSSYSFFRNLLTSRPNHSLYKGEYHAVGADNCMVFNSACRNSTKENLMREMTVYEDFVTDNEEKSLLEEIEPVMKRLRYEYDHWDDAIHGYKEIQRLQWNPENAIILQHISDLAFPPGKQRLASVHVLDLSDKGFVKPHIDSTTSCGSIIAGLSLLSDSIMRLVGYKSEDQEVNILLKRRSLYIMKDSVRYDYKHEILSAIESDFRGYKVYRSRRVSLIFRCQPEPIESGRNTSTHKLAWHKLIAN